VDTQARKWTMELFLPPQQAVAIDGLGLKIIALNKEYYSI